MTEPAQYKILAIDTSCDETSVAISNRELILANIISSQIELHKQWGGVVPTIAERAHREKILPIVTMALKRAKLSLNEIDYFAVTVGPGLSIALAVGIETAKQLAIQQGKPLIAVNHMVGHVYANFAKNKVGHSSADKFVFPALALLVSGGHTEIVLIRSENDWEIIGQTLDDALGEAYDKVARILNLGYPGGPIVARFAKFGNPLAFDLPVPMLNSGDLNFSFSGLKTAVLHVVRELNKSTNQAIGPQQTYDLCATFQRVAIKSVIIKLSKAVTNYNVKQVLLGGGVVANTQLRQEIRRALPKNVTLHYPNLKKLCTDNAAMIAVAAYHQAQRNEFIDPNIIDRQPNLSIKSH